MRTYKIKSDWRKTRGSDKIITTYSMNTDYINMPDNTLFKDNWDSITYSSLGVFSIQFRVYTHKVIYDETIQKKVRHYITNNISKRNITIVEQVSNKNDWNWYRVSLTIRTPQPTKVEIEKIIDDVSKIILDEEININSTTNNTIN